MDRCGTCKHWDNDSISNEPEWGTCKRVTDTSEEEGYAYVKDESLYMAALKSHNNFGCVLYTPLFDFALKNDEVMNSNGEYMGEFDGEKFIPSLVVLNMSPVIQAWIDNKIRTLVPM